MKRMHASVPEHVVLDGLLEGTNIPVNSKNGKILKACFDAIEQKKPLPYIIDYAIVDESVYRVGFMRYLPADETVNETIALAFIVERGATLEMYYRVQKETTDGSYILESL